MTEPSLIFSYTEGPIIAAKLLDKKDDVNYIRMGVSFPLQREKYKSRFHPQENYVSHLILDALPELNLIDTTRKFLVRKADICYGNSLEIVDTASMRGTEAVTLMREPLNEGSDITLDELGVLLNSLVAGNEEVSFYKTGGCYLSASIPYNDFTQSFGSQLDLLDIEIPAPSLGCRIEFFLPEELYEMGKIEKPFDRIAQAINFGQTLSRLERMHEEFLSKKEESKKRDRKKVVSSVEV